MLSAIYPYCHHAFPPSPTPLWRHRRGLVQRDERVSRIGPDNSASVPDACSRGRFEAYFVVDRISEALLASKVPLRGLDAHMDGACH